jgi:hypothetical protein
MRHGDGAPVQLATAADDALIACRHTLFFSARIILVSPRSYC